MKELKKRIGLFFALTACSLLFGNYLYGQVSGAVTYQGNWPLSEHRVVEGKAELIFEGAVKSSFEALGVYKNLRFDPGENIGWEDNPDPQRVVIKNIDHGDTTRMNYFRTHDPCNIYVDFEKGELLQLLKIRKKNSSSEGDSIFYLSEETGIINWLLHDTEKQIGSYTCQKATTRFRGRDYTVWFAPEIPVNFGPWKLNGLPGLILEVADANQEVNFFATSITIEGDSDEWHCHWPGDYPIHSYKEYRIAAWEEYREIEKLAEERSQRLSARAPQGVKITRTLKISTTGIELEFEFLPSSISAEPSDTP